MPEQPLRAAKLIIGFVVLLYVIEAVNDVAFGGQLVQYGIRPHDAVGLTGILWAPLLHGGFAHLAANTVPVLVFGWLAMSGGIGEFLVMTATVWLLGGFGTWLFAQGGDHIGASGLAFGWFVFLLVRGLFTRGLAQILVAVVLFVLWGSMLWGMLPGQQGISWQGHLCGALAGLLAAWMAGRAHRARSARADTAG